jgi:putative transposase
LLCAYFEKSRAAYYKAQVQHERKSTAQQAWLQEVRKHRYVHPRMGGRKTRKLLSELPDLLPYAMGRDRFFKLLSEQDLLVRRKRRWVHTTDPDHPFYRYPNVARQLQVDRPEKLWVSDITYLRVRNRFAYLFLITDAYSRKIVGWKVSDSLKVEGALNALRMALAQRSSTQHTLMHHSDRGLQYCSHEYTSRLQREHIDISMTEGGDCYQNALAERVNGILKDEYALDSRFHSLYHATQVTKQAITIYNELRPHWSLQLKCPSSVHSQNRKKEIK